MCMDRTKYEIEIKHHVFIRALTRGITPDRIEDVIMNGRIELFANDRVRFVKEGSKRTLVCVGEIRGLKIVVFTIEIKGDEQ